MATIITFGTIRYSICSMQTIRCQ